MAWHRYVGRRDVVLCGASVQVSERIHSEIHENGVGGVVLKPERTTTTTSTYKEGELPT